MSYHYGAWKGPGPSYFRVVVAYKYDTYTDDTVHMYLRRYVEVKEGSDFGGTILATSWSSNVRIYGAGTYADTGWNDLGAVEYGHYDSTSAKASYTGSSYYESSGTWGETAESPVWAPYAPTNASVTRNSDTKNTIKWTNNICGARPYANIIIERSVDGGSWSAIGTLAGDATSYADGSTSANHYYRYRVKAKNATASSDYATTEYVYNTPAAPTSVAASRSGETSVDIAITNPAVTATALELQRSTDGSTWSTLATIDGKVTSTSDNPGGGTFYYRARNTRADLLSDWSQASNAVVTICAPNAPTLVSPASSEVMKKSDSNVTFKWLHNPIDGSAQTSAQLRYSTDSGASYTTVDISGNEQQYAIDNSFDVNSTVIWSVRTKGAHSDYGPWSANRAFSVYQVPSVSFEQPASGFVIENTPVNVKLQYDDASGSLANAKIAIYDGASVVYERDMGTSVQCSIASSEWLPENGKTYTLTTSVRSTSTLTASATRDVAVDFVLPQPAAITIEPDDEKGYVNLLVDVQSQTDEFVQASSISIYRNHDGERVLLAEGLSAGACVVDKYAPLNDDYSYEAVSFAESGAANIVAYDYFMDTDCAFMYFRDGIVKCEWNPSSSWDITPSVEYVNYAGRKYPVAYVEDFLDEGHSVSVELKNREEAKTFRRMIMAHEPVVVKLWDGLVFYAIPKISASQDTESDPFWGSVKIDLTRIDGDAL